eukprot:3866059-Pyramimonas_sp.AAC.1
MGTGGSIPTGLSACSPAAFHRPWKLMGGPKELPLSLSRGARYRQGAGPPRSKQWPPISTSARPVPSKATRTSSPCAPPRTSTAPHTTGACGRGRSRATHL